MKKKSDKLKDHTKILSTVSNESKSERDSRKSPEPYTCTGNFLNDFTELAYRAGLHVVPPVISRPRMPPPEVKVETKGKGKQVEIEPEPELNEDGEPVESPPKTFLLKDGRDYFKPTVQVELDHNEKYDSVSEIYIRGWKIDETMANIFRSTLPLLDKLHTVNLWRVGLTSDVLASLGILLPLCVNVKTLILDNNPIPEQNYHVVLGENTSLVSLSLRYCDITAIGSLPLANALGNPYKYNTKLFHLNLSGNKLGDEGASHLATALRTNRALVTLNLCSNEIGDKGIASLAETLSRFALTHTEVVERRKLTSTYIPFSDRISPVSSRRAESRDRPTSARGLAATKRDKSSKKKGDGKKDAKEDAKSKKEEKGLKKGGKQTSATIVIDQQTKGANKTKETKKGKKEKTATPHEQEPMEVPESVNALMDQVEHIENELWISGNMALVSLNLNRNLCTDVGCASLLKAIQYQTTIAMDTRNTSHTGLMRLCLNKNKISSDCPELLKLNEMMLTKDPFFKSKTPDEDPQVDASTKG